MNGVRAGGAGNTFQAGTDSTRNAKSPYRRSCAPSRCRCFPIPTDTPGGNRRRGSRRRSAVPGRAGMAHSGAVGASCCAARVARLGFPTRRGRPRRSVRPARGGPEPVPASKAAFPPGRDGLAGRRPGARPGPRATGRESATWVDCGALGGRCQRRRSGSATRCRLC